jgi:hypothetical protein
MLMLRSICQLIACDAQRTKSAEGPWDELGLFEWGVDESADGDGDQRRYDVRTSFSTGMFLPSLLLSSPIYDASSVVHHPVVPSLLNLFGSETVHIHFPRLRHG